MRNNAKNWLWQGIYNFCIGEKCQQPLLLYRVILATDVLVLLPIDHIWIWVQKWGPISLCWEKLSLLATIYYPVDIPLTSVFDIFTRFLRSLFIWTKISTKIRFLQDPFLFTRFNLHAFELFSQTFDFGVKKYSRPYFLPCYVLDILLLQLDTKLIECMDLALLCPFAYMSYKLQKWNKIPPRIRLFFDDKNTFRNSFFLGLLQKREPFKVNE